MATAAESPAASLSGPPPRRPRPIVVAVLMMACGGAYVAAALFGGQLSPDLLTLICCGAKDRALILGGGEWWRLVSAGFLHGSLVHLAVNLYALYALGPLVEHLWGRARFFLIYVAAVVGGNLASLAFTKGVSVGASGGVFGLLGAIVVFATVHRRLIVPEARRGLWIKLAIVLGINLYLGWAVTFIDQAAHLGGFAAGLVFARVVQPFPLREPARPAAELMVRLVTAAAAGATAWSLGMAAYYARSSDWILLARTEMETRELEGEGLCLDVPRGWAYEPPKKGRPTHVFQREGLAVVEIRAVPVAEGVDVAPFVRGLITRCRREACELVDQRDIRVRGRTGAELVFRVQRPRRAAARLRMVVFPRASEELLRVSFLCAPGRHRVLDVLFDGVLQSVRPTEVSQVFGPSARLRRLPRPGDPAGHEFWERFHRDRRDAAAAFALAAFYRNEGRPEYAEQILRVALAVRPDYADAHDQLADLYTTAPGRLRQPRQAIRHARRALALRPDTPRYLATLALACEAAGDRAAALQAAQQAARLAPDDAAYAELVDRLRRPPAGPPAD